MQLQDLGVHFPSYSRVLPYEAVVLQSWGGLCRTKHSGSSTSALLLVSCPPLHHVAAVLGAVGKVTLLWS